MGSPIKLYVALIVAVLIPALAKSSFSEQAKATSGSTQKLNIDQVISVEESDAWIKDAYQKFRSDFWVRSQGVVTKILKDDNDGAQHQRFLLRLSNGHKILIAHNIDIASRIQDLKAGDVVAFYGEYEWNNKGGVIHWTHHDPFGYKTGGWLMHKGKKYQ